MDEKNAIITNAEIFVEDHGYLTAMLYLDYGDSGAQGFGGYALQHNSAKHEKNFAGVFIRRVLEIVEVDSWDKLVGKTVRVRASHEKVHAIGNIVKNKWFNPSEELHILEKGDENDT
jgi:hypothetical protein